MMSYLLGGSADEAAAVLDVNVDGGLFVDAAGVVAERRRASRR